MPCPVSVVESTASGNLSFLTTALPGEVETMSRSQIASRFSVSEGYLTYNFGAELRMLSQKHRNRKLYDKELRKKDLQVIVYRAVSHRTSRSRTTNSDGVLADVPTNRLRDLVNLTESRLETMIFQGEEKRSKKEKSS